MLIFIEGCDRTGKSTIAEMIAKNTFSKVVHCSKPKTSDPFNEYLEMLLSYRDCQTMVFDRGYLGEFVYSQLWRDGCKITPEQFHILDKVALSKRAVVIHAFADSATILKRCEQVGEDLLKPDQVSRCLSLFQEIIGHTLLPVYKYPSHSIKPEEFIEDFFGKVRREHCHDRIIR